VTTIRATFVLELLIRAAATDAKITLPPDLDKPRPKGPRVPAKGSHHFHLIDDAHSLAVTASPLL